MPRLLPLGTDIKAVPIKAAKSTVSVVQMHFLTEPPFREDAEAIFDQQHADQRFRVNPRAASEAVEVCNICADAGRINRPISQQQQMILCNGILE